jgi:flagellin-like hook-associated protein FlgL
MAKTQERLATGLKVNSALDNPTNFFTASSLNSRASDMASLLDSMSNGIKTIEAANNGLTSITKTVESMQSTLRQARQDKSFKTGSYSLNVGATPAGTEKLTLSGGAVGATGVDVALTTTTGGTTVPPQAGTITAGSFSAMDFTAAAPTAGKATLTGANFATSTFGTGDTLSFDIAVDGGSATTVTIAASDVTGIGDNDATIDNITELASAINAAGLPSGVSAAVNSGNLVFTSATTGASSSVAISNVTPTDTSTDGTITGAGLGAVTSAGGQAAGAAKTLSFDVAVDGGSASTVTINLAAVQAAGDNDGIIDSVAELATIIDSQLGSGVTVDGSGATLSLKSATTGTASNITISNTAATNVTNTSGVADGTDAGAAASNSGGTVAAKTVDALVTEINNNTSLNTAVRASNDNGKLRIENLSTSDLSVVGVNSTSGDATGGTGSSNTVAIGGNEVRKNLAKQFNELRDQLDKLADDASFNGINLLRGDKLKLTFNETGTSTIDIQAKDSDGNATSINNTTLGISTALDSDLDSDTKIDAKLATLADSLGSLRSQSSGFGSNLSIVQNRTDFTKNMINTLETGAANLTLADTNEEAANLLALQTRQQLSSTALSMASQADQAVLRLF